MTYVITEPCIGAKDTACVSVCPADCIAPTRHDPAFASAAQLYIDPDHCLDCGLCVDECPVRAIFADVDVPEPWRHYIQLNAEHFKR